ncbi:MAG: hypothetical protein FJ191_01835 [Gammaproteobacteria bacterium]|nr:hypothetical protein [Gammaproteobacteria bacterium]
MNRMSACALAPTLAGALLMTGCAKETAEPVAATPPEAAATGPDAVIADALSAALPSMAAEAAVMDWDGTMLKSGTGRYTCMPTPPHQKAAGIQSPMCMDETWMQWAHAWEKREPFQAAQVGISYMLGGDGGASNIDPYATEATPDNQWVVEGPHLMILVPDPGMLEGIPTDPDNGGPYVMWKGTPYAHVMVPVAD